MGVGVRVGIGVFVGVGVIVGVGVRVGGGDLSCMSIVECQVVFSLLLIDEQTSPKFFS